jgi:hypothetical protein
MMVVLWTRKRQMGKDENKMEDTSGYEKLGVPLACLGSADLLSAIEPAGSGLVPSIFQMVHQLAHQILGSSSLS